MLKLGRMVSLAFVFSTACALAVNGQEESKKAEIKKEAKQQNRGAKVGRSEHWQVGDPSGTIEKVDAEKKTITIREEDGPLHAVTIDEDVAVKNFNGNPVSGFDEKQLCVGAFVGWKPNGSGKITQLFVGAQPGFGGRVPGAAGRLKKIEPKEGKTKEKDKNKEEKKGETTPQKAAR